MCAVVKMAYFFESENERWMIKSACIIHFKLALCTIVITSSSSSSLLLKAFEGAFLVQSRTRDLRLRVRLHIICVRSIAMFDQSKCLISYAEQFKIFSRDISHTNVDRKDMAGIIK